MRTLGSRLCRFFSLLIIALVGAAPLVGCQATDLGPQTRLGTANGLETRGPANAIRWDLDTFEASSPGLGVGSVLLTDEGLTAVSAKSGDDRIAGFIVPMVNREGVFLDDEGRAVAVKVFLTDPADTRFERLSSVMHPDGRVEFVVEGFDARGSPVIAARSPDVIEALQASGRITETQARVAIEEAARGVEVFQALTNAGVDVARLFVPVPPLINGGGE